MKSLLIILLTGMMIFNQDDARKDALIVSGTGHCSAPLREKRVKNNSDSKTMTVTIEERLIIGKTRSSHLMVIEKLAPKEEKYIGCAGCIASAEASECTFFYIKSAAYITP